MGSQPGTTTRRLAVNVDFANRHPLEVLADHWWLDPEVFNTEQAFEGQVASGKVGGTPFFAIDHPDNLNHVKTKID